MPLPLVRTNFVQAVDETIADPVAAALVWGLPAGWDVLLVDWMDQAFENKIWNEDMSAWDLSQTTDFWLTFAGTCSYNGTALNGWNASNFGYLQQTFFTNQTFNQPLNNWDTSNVYITRYMFAGSIFNQDISSWNMSFNGNMSSMFESCEFAGDISNWRVDSCTDMNRLIANNIVFTSDLREWNVPPGCDLTDMFLGATAFNALYDSDPNWGTTPNIAFFNQVLPAKPDYSFVADYPYITDAQFIALLDTSYDHFFKAPRNQIEAASESLNERYSLAELQAALQEDLDAR